MAFGFAYRWLDHNVLSYILVFIRGFEQALVMLTVITFLLFKRYRFKISLIPGMHFGLY